MVAELYCPNYECTAEKELENDAHHKFGLGVQMWNLDSTMRLLKN